MGARRGRAAGGARGGRRARGDLRALVRRAESAAPAPSGAGVALRDRRRAHDPSRPAALRSGAPPCSAPPPEPPSPSAARRRGAAAGGVVGDVAESEARGVTGAEGAAGGVVGDVAESEARGGDGRRGRGGGLVRLV